MEIDIDRTNSEPGVCVCICALLSYGMMNFVCFACYSLTSLQVFHFIVCVCATLIVRVHTVFASKKNDLHRSFHWFYNYIPCWCWCIPSVYLNLYGNHSLSPAKRSRAYTLMYWTRKAFSHNVTAKLASSSMSTQTHNPHHQNRLAKLVKDH